MAPAASTWRWARLALCALAGASCVGVLTARAQTSEELGDTKAPPPTNAELGDEPSPPPATPPPAKRARPKSEPSADGGSAPAAPPGTPDAAPEAPAGSAPDAGVRRRARQPTDAGPTAAPPVRPQAPAALPATPTPAVAPTVAPAVAPSDEVTARARSALRALDEALAREPADQRALEQAATNGAQDALVAAEPALRPLVRLARARALLVQKRFDEAQTALADARAAADSLSGRAQKRTIAQIRYRGAELEELKSKAPDSCGLELGLTRLAQTEGGAARARTERLAQRFRAVAQSGDRFWGRRAAFKTAMLYEDLFRRTLVEPKSFRGVTFPNPFAIGTAETGALLQQVSAGPWPAEIARIYGEIVASIDARDPDPQLLELVRARGAAFGRRDAPAGEVINNPWRNDERPGLVRFFRRFEELQPGGGWKALDNKDGRARAAAQLARGPGNVEHAFALVALAEGGPAPAPDAILAALTHEDARVRLAGLVAAEKAPNVTLLDALFASALRADAAEARREPFSSVARTLFGERERALLALRALAQKDHAAAALIVANEKLPARERVWLVAELGETSFGNPLRNWAYDKDATVAATAIFGGYLAIGKNALSLARDSADGVVGCASRAVVAMDAKAAQ